MTGEWAVQADGIGKSYGTGTVLAGVDLRIPRGSVFALLGPNGAGKTTLVRILATLLRADTGQARVAGFDVVADRRRVRHSISLTGQDVALDGRQTGEENLRMMGRLVGLSGAQARRRARDLLVRFDLEAAGGRLVRTYSGGMRRRLDLAASLLGRPEVIFLDEPTTGLDPHSRQDVWQIVTGLPGTGVTVFLTTQYLEEADRLANRIAILDGGRIVADGTATDLKQRIVPRRLDLTLTDPVRFDRVVRVLGDRVVHQDVAELTVGVPTDGSAAQIRVLLDEVDPDRVGVARFGVHTATLDDVFLALTGHHATGHHATGHHATGHHATTESEKEAVRV